MADTRIEYPGGEMDGWSDARGDGHCDVRARFARQLIPAGATKVLLVGARASGLAAQLKADGHVVTCVVRGVADADPLVSAGAEVICGDLLQWSPQHQFDLAICLDAPRDVLPASSAGIGDVDLAELLRDRARDYLAYVENGAGLPALDQTSRTPKDDREFAAAGSGYDLRPPTRTNLPAQPIAAVFSPAVVASALAPLPATATLLRSLLVDDLRYDALLSDVLAVADGWLLGSLPVGEAVIYRRLDGSYGEALPTVTGTPVETRIRQALLRGDEHRAREGLSAFFNWVGSATSHDRGPLLRNAVAGEHSFTPIDPDVQEIELPVLALDVATAIAGRAEAHLFGVEATPEEIAAELLRLATTLPDPAASVRDAGATYDASPLARSARRVSPVEQQLVNTIRAKDAQLASVRSDLAKDRRHLRALEHAFATEAGPRAKRAYFLMTAPTKRLLEAARRRKL